jgi:hypothetical protein
MLVKGMIAYPSHPCFHPNRAWLPAVRPASAPTVGVQGCWPGSCTLLFQVNNQWWAEGIGPVGPAAVTESTFNKKTKRIFEAIRTSNLGFKV